MVPGSDVTVPDLSAPNVTVSADLAPGMYSTQWEALYADGTLAVPAVLSTNQVQVKAQIVVELVLTLNATLSIG